jgi:integrase/recombinase XerC
MNQIISDYRDYLRRLPISEHTKRNYFRRVKAYIEWLACNPDSENALKNVADRDFAVRDFKLSLLHKGLSSASVNAVLSSIDNFYIYLGLGTAKVKRQELPEQAPKSLTPEEQFRFVKAATRLKSNRNRALCMLMLHCGLRVSEIAALDVRDVFVTARKGEVIVRCGKNSKQRRVPLNTAAREALIAYLTEPRDPNEPLFKSQRGTRISVGAIAYFIRQIAREAGIEMTSHSLRHTCLTKLIRSGCDIVIVAEVAGHGRLETTRRYSLPTADDKIAAMEKLSHAK